MSVLRDLVCVSLNLRYTPGPKREATKFNIQVVGLSVKYRFGPKNIHCGPEDLVVVCPVRDGAEFVQQFIEHHSSLGAKHIVFLDNGSQDQTISKARNEYS